MISIDGNRIAKIYVDGEEIDSSMINEEDFLRYLFVDSKSIELDALSPCTIYVEANKEWNAK